MRVFSLVDAGSAMSAEDLGLAAGSCEVCHQSVVVALCCPEHRRSVCNACYLTATDDPIECGTGAP